MEVYAAMVDSAWIRISGGFLMRSTRLGIADNTLIMFLSDNGSLCRNARPAATTPSIAPGPKEWYSATWGRTGLTRRMRRFAATKSHTHEGGIATPFRGPLARENQGRDRERIRSGHIIDFLPTFLEMGSGEYPRE